jgi:D-alanyl-D-alanine carboxypeptidase (penicillin-binding protein 5/6)
MSHTTMQMPTTQMPTTTHASASLQDPASVQAPALYSARTLHHGRRPRRRIRAIVAAVVLLFTTAGSWGAINVLERDQSAPARSSGIQHSNLAVYQWPSDGQASFSIDGAETQSSPNQTALPIASLAKVMTAYLVLRHDPLAADESGFRFAVTAADEADTKTRQKRQESVVAVRAGETLTERQALVALLLPSANNVAIMLARHTSGNVDTFVKEMNDTARKLGMSQTTYTDPSGFDAGTRSTAADQVLMAQAAMRDATFASIVALREYELPVEGTVRNTDSLLGKQGFVGIKTGSLDSAGGCFMFRTKRIVGGQTMVVTGVVLGQHGPDLIAAGLDAASQLADRIAPLILKR